MRHLYAALQAATKRPVEQTLRATALPLQCWVGGRTAATACSCTHHPYAAAPTHLQAQRGQAVGLLQEHLDASLGNLANKQGKGTRKKGWVYR